MKKLDFENKSMGGGTETGHALLDWQIYKFTKYFTHVITR